MRKPEVSPIWRGSVPQRIRLGSGLILFAFATTHFLNHALGLVSLDAMNGFDALRVAVIRSWPGTLVLSVALAAHIVFSLAKLAARRTLRMPPWEAAQIAMGLAIPLLLFPHIVNTRVAATFFGVQDTYAYELARIWPATMPRQTMLLLLVWVHGCMGLHYWLRILPGYGRVAPVLLAGAVLLPFAAVTGISVQGRATAAAIADPQQLAALKAETNWPDDGRARGLEAVTSHSLEGVVASLALTGAFFLARSGLRRRGQRATVTYVGGPAVLTFPGETLLEISRRANVRHLSVCGGRGRCSTCRVVVLRGAGNLDPPSALEAATLAAVEAGPRMRLACQAKPRGDVTVKPLLQAATTVSFVPADLVDAPAVVERDLAVLFVDMRGFTTLTERKLAFDVVYILNQFFNTVGKPIYDCGGVITNYAGDGLIALFADPDGLAAACRSAVLAAGEIDRAVEDLNGQLASDLHHPISVAMGLHAGPHVQGRIGYKDAVSTSVVGLAMNIASRMETLAKQRGVQLALSQTVADDAGLDTDGLQVETTEVRGLQAPLGVVLVGAARDLSSRLGRVDATRGPPMLRDTRTLA